MKFLRKKRNIQTEEIDITSLLDILVILLVFLLQNMANTDLIPEIVANLDLPYSQSLGTAKRGVIIQVNEKKQVFLGSEEINFDLDQTGQDELLIKSLKKLRSDQFKIENKKIEYLNILVDRGLEYKYVQKIMNVSVKAGFLKFKLIVQGSE